MTASVRERILQNVESTLDAMTTTRFAKVVRADFYPWTGGPFPLAMVFEPDDTYRQEQNRGSSTILSVDMALDVMCVLQKPGVDKATPTNEVVANVIKALLTDPTRGGLAIYTDPARVSVSVMDEAQSLAAAQLSFVVHYRHLRTDPTS